MKRFVSVLAIGLLGLPLVFQSCDTDNDDNWELVMPTAIVTVCPDEDGSFVMNLDNSTVLVPVNMQKSPFGDKEVRALVNYTETGDAAYGVDMRDVRINWIDSVRTKRPVVSTGNDDEAFGNDPIEIVADWVTVAEDGYVTLRIRTLWDGSRRPHELNLVTGVNPEDPFEMALHHNAGGDIYGEMGDALIAFNLNDMPGFDGTVGIRLRWMSFSGEKSAELELPMRSRHATGGFDASLRQQNTRIV